MHPAKTHILVFAGRTCHFVGFVMLWLIYQYYHNNPKFSDRQVWANSVDLDQTVRQEQSDQGLHCLPFHLHIWVHYSVESNRVQILGWLQQIFLVSEFLGFLHLFFCRIYKFIPILGTFYCLGQTDILNVSYTYQCFTCIFLDKAIFVLLFRHRNRKYNKPYVYSECACMKSITLYQVKGQPV